jgi:cysteine desulfurase family protein
MDKRLERPLIYLDNAATSYPKSERVIEKMNELMISYGGNPGRSSHFLAFEAATRVFECRERVSSFFDADGAEQVCFTSNTTEGLNLVIKGLLRRGDHVLISDMEHNAVYRPIYKLWREGVIEYDVFPSFVLSKERTPSMICAGIAGLMRRNTRMLVCSGASNICSLEMPLREIGDFCRKNGIIFVVDGAQCAGHMPISLKQMRIDALCIPAHKGLLGPQGCGAVVFGKGITPDTLTEGGNGIASLDGEMSDGLPERYEAGTLPTPAIIGLGEGVSIVTELGLDKISQHERALFDRAAEKLESIRGVKVFCPQHRGSVLLFSLDMIGSEELCARLSQEGICTRGGFHCCALGHKTLGTEKAGAVRISFGVYNSSRDVDALADALQRISKEII